MMGPGSRRRRLIRKIGDWPPGSLLGGLGEPAREELLGLGRPRQFTTGETLIRAGDRPQGALLLVDACVMVTAPAEDGGTALLMIHFGGDLLAAGAAGGLGGDMTATAAGPCLVMHIPDGDLGGFLRRRPEVALAASRAASARARHAGRVRSAHGTVPLLKRLAGVIVELAWSYGEPVREGVMIGVAVTLPELAALVGATDPAVHRALALLRRAGVLGTGYRRVVVHDLRRLRTFAGLGDDPLEYDVPA